MAKKKLLDLRHPFFAPLWKRVVTVVVIGGWTMFELSTGKIAWAMIFGALAAYCAYEFFVIFEADNYVEEDDDDPSAQT